MSVEHGPFHLGPLVGFDTETTGTDVRQDRIVTASLVFSPAPGAELKTWEWVIDAGVDIPPGATEVHGVTNEFMREHGKPPVEALSEMDEVIEEYLAGGAALVVFNASYDLTLFRNELARHKVKDVWMDPFPVIDPYVLDKAADKYRPGSRKLSDMAAGYGVTVQGAHDATADCVMALGIARELPVRFPKLGRPAPLVHQWQIGWKAQQAAGLQQYLRKSNPAAVVNPGWPLEGEK